MTAIIVTWINTSKLVIIIKYFKLKTNQYLQLCWPLCWCWGKEFPILKIQSHSKNCINERNGNCNKYFINVKHCKFILEICFVKLAFYKLLFFLAKHIVLPIHLQYIVFPHLRHLHQEIKNQSATCEYTIRLCRLPFFVVCLGLESRFVVKWKQIYLFTADGKIFNLTSEKLTI